MKFTNFQYFGRFLPGLKAQRGGYALAVTLVFVALAVTIAGGLSINRQMWGHMGEKQLHRILTQTALDVDSLAMMTELRLTLEAAEQEFVSLPVSSGLGAFSPRTTLSISPLSSDLSSSSVVYSSTTRVALPEGSSVDGFSLELGTPFYDWVVGDEDPVILGMWDPYREIWSKTVAFGVLTENELVGAARADKSVRPVRNEAGKWVSGSRLHAWTEVDTAKIHEIVVRRIPATAFTLFVPTSGEWETLSLGYWVADGSHSLPMGRYYTETQFVPGRSYLNLDLPLVAAGGINWDAWQWDEMQPSMKLRVQDVSSGGGLEGGDYQRPIRYVSNVLSASDPKSFYKNRYSSFGGLISTGMDRPVVFRRFGGHGAFLSGIRSAEGIFTFVNFPVGESSPYGEWFPPSPGTTNFDTGTIPVAQQGNYLAQLWSRADVRVFREDVDTMNYDVRTGYSEMAGAAIFNGAVSVDDASKEILLDFRGFSGEALGVSEMVLFLSAGGVDEFGDPISLEDRNSYYVRVWLPDMTTLGFSAEASLPAGVGGLTIVSPHPVIIEDNFNSGGSTVPVMVVAQNLVAGAFNGTVVNWKGVFLTVGASMGTEGNPFLYGVQGYPNRVPSKVMLEGSMLFWQRGVKPVLSSDGTIWPSVDVKLMPSSLYLSGMSYPPGTPALMDLRFGRERLQNYRIYSEDTVFTPDDEEEFPGES